MRYKRIQRLYESEILGKHINEKELKELADYFDIELNEKLGDGILSSIRKKIELMKSALGYILTTARKVVKNTGDRDKIKEIENQATKIEKDLANLENNVAQILDYMFGDDSLGSLRRW